MYSLKKIKDFLETISPLEYLKKFPHKDLKMFSTDFIFRQQKILLTTRIVVLKSCYYATKYYSCPGESCFSATCLQTKLILPNALPVMYLDKKSETVFAAQMACIVLVGRHASYNWLKSKLDQIPQLINYYCVNFHSRAPTVMFGQLCHLVPSEMYCDCPSHVRAERWFYKFSLANKAKHHAKT